MNRTPCIHKCGRLAGEHGGECRKCRKARLLRGRRVVAKNVERVKTPARSFFGSAKEQYQHAKKLTWERPAQIVRGLFVKPAIKLAGGVQR